MIEVIKSPTPITEKTQWTVFLAGPMNGAPSWQAQAPKVAANVGIENVTFLNPQDRSVRNRYLSGELGNLRTPHVRCNHILDSASGPSDEALAFLRHHHKIGTG